MSPSRRVDIFKGAILLRSGVLAFLFFANKLHSRFLCLSYRDCPSARFDILLFSYYRSTDITRSSYRRCWLHQTIDQYSVQAALTTNQRSQTTWTKLPPIKLFGTSSLSAFKIGCYDLIFLLRDGMSHLGLCGYLGSTNDCDVQF